MQGTTQQFEKNTISSDRNKAYQIRLPVIDLLLEHAKTLVELRSLQRTAIFYVHHPLQTSINVVDAIIQLGAHPENIYILGKCYSECESVVSNLIEKGVHYQPCSSSSGLGAFSCGFIRDINWMWANLIENLSEDIEQILILDHGGHAINYFPPELLRSYKVIGIEKTTAGFISNAKRGQPPIPLIDVANSAAKRYLESPLIADAIVGKIASFIPDNAQDYIFGVVGIGSIGKAITNRLQQLGCKIIVHDTDYQKLIDVSEGGQVLKAQSLSSLIAASDFIFGCSGQDITSEHLELIRFSPKNKTFISCSSEDKEFLSLLHMINKSALPIFDPLEDIIFKNDLDVNIKIVRGGFPANFDHTGESVPAKDIQLTRGLVVASIIQAIKLFRAPSLSNKVYSLAFDYQKLVVEEWMKHQSQISLKRYSGKLNLFKNEAWVNENSIYDALNYAN